jgi:two-component system sensor histidine kinase BaeS
MIDYIRERLGVKLFLSYLGVILIAVVILALSTNFALPTAFNRHLGQMEQLMGSGVTGDGGMMGSAGHGQGLGRGQGQPGLGQGVAYDLYVNFKASFSDALTLAGIAAALVAVVVSLVFSRRVVAPVRAMMHASRRIAEGQYRERVEHSGPDELGQLADSFNQMADKLEQVEVMRRQLIGDVSHELRTPLTAIKGSMEGLVDGVLPATAETFEQIFQEADRLSRLVNDLQELSRVESGSFDLDLHPISVEDLAKTTVRRLAHQFERKGVILEADLKDDSLVVSADEDRLGQVMLNLVGNALQYTPSGGRVVIRATCQWSEARRDIQDTGVGIPAEHLPHLFDRFYRVDKSRSRGAGGGSGIGLTIARYIVEAHGGRIWVESRGAGSGSTFSFTLPIDKT